MKLQTPSLLTIKQSYLKDKKSSDSVLNFLKDFFEENLGTLSLSYPGIKQSLFVEEFKFFSKVSLLTSIFDSSFSKKWSQFLKLLEVGVPLEYINNRAFFFESFFYVNESVLIPRFETEILLENLLSELSLLSSKGNKSISLCEVGVGPGTIGFSILKNFSKLAIKFHGIDICDEALKVAKINEHRLKPNFSADHKVTLSLGDRLFGIEEQFDIIVSNPPYIKKDADNSLVHKMVLEHEPEVALFLEDDLYESWFLELFEQVKKCLNNSGLFLMEGHESHLVQLGRLCENVFNSPVEIISDLSGAARLLKVRKVNG